MGNGASRNKRCSCGSGKKQKFCTCSSKKTDKKFPYVIETDFGIFNALGAYKLDNYKDIEPTFENMQYAPFYNQEQIIKINNPASGYDVLLKKQADSIVENMRITREMHHLHNSSENWNVTDYFYEKAFDMFFLSIARTKYYPICKAIPYGATFDSDPNGACIKTDFGNIITVSIIMRQYLYYMNLFYMGLADEEISMSVAISAQVLGLRIMLRTESLDFNMDPRGEIPPHIHERMDSNATWSMLFIIAHEFSHSLLGHLDESNVTERCCINQTVDVIYNQDQQQEFEADLHAIKLLLESYTLDDVLNGSISFFVFLDLYEQAKDQIFPSASLIKTHPPAQDRINNILNVYGKDEENRYFHQLLEINQMLKEQLQDRIACNFEQYETYGSVYLAEWHKTNLIDRVDY